MALLEGITVLDLASLLPAPFTAHLFAKLGARVIKVESPTRPDPAREFGFTPKGGVSAMYRALNSNKSLEWIDLKTPDGRTKLHELVKSADALIEGYRPDVRSRLGIEYETLQKINPRLVMVSVMGYNPAGKYRARAGHDMNFVARSGILDQTRDDAGRCVPLGAPLADYAVGYSAAFRMAAALASASRTGLGCHIEVSIEEALREIQTPFLAEIQESGEMPRAGETFITGRFPCYRLYALPGGTLAVGALEEKFWKEFCDRIGLPALLGKQFARGAERDAVVRQVQAALETKPFAEWVKIFEKADCCVDPVLSIQEVLNGV